MEELVSRRAVKEHDSPSCQDPGSTSLLGFSKEPHVVMTPKETGTGEIWQGEGARGRNEERKG